ncbi:MAG: helix-turn-helix domain-containing protein [Opitutaceae bacterium]
MHYLPHLQRAIDEIEPCLREPIAIERIARRAGFSYWHFQRLFAACVGEPVGFYIRRRRLTLAADELRTTRRRILDIALDFQFGSHEAFTRAFRGLFHISPSEFRRRPHYVMIRTRPVLTADRLKHLVQNASMKPLLIQLPALTLIGPEAHFISAMSPDANNLKVIPPLWQQLFRRLPEAGAPLDNYKYGACRWLLPGRRAREDELEYLAGISVAPASRAPAGMGKWKLLAATYALFTHRGPITKLSETINFAHGAWLPRSDFEYDDRAAELERYDDRFNPTAPDSEMDYLLSVRPKK